jgi:glutathione S-transferase
MSKPKQPLRIYRNLLSGHSHRVELLCSILGLPVELVDVDMSKGEHKAPQFLEKNPLGQVPVVEDGDVRLRDSGAILVYLASFYDESGQWYPRDAIVAARIQQWLSVAAGQLAAGPHVARLVSVFKLPLDREKAKGIADQLFALLDKHLASSKFLAGESPTIADLAIYTYTAHAPEGGVSLEPWSNVKAWLARVEAIRGFVPMQSSKAA